MGPAPSTLVHHPRVELSLGAPAGGCWSVRPTSRPSVSQFAGGPIGFAPLGEPQSQSQSAADLPPRKQEVVMRPVAHYYYRQGQRMTLLAESSTGPIVRGANNGAAAKGRPQFAGPRGSMSPELQLPIWTLFLLSGTCCFSWPFGGTSLGARRARNKQTGVLVCVGAPNCASVTQSFRARRRAGRRARSEKREDEKVASHDGRLLSS